MAIFVICVFSSSHVNFNTQYLNKFIWVGVIGYAVQWQIFGSIAKEYMLESAESIAPPFTGNFANMFFIASCLYFIIWCFKGNKARRDPLEKWSLSSKEKRIEKVS